LPAGPILGIDPGLQVTGFAIVDPLAGARSRLRDAGVIRLDPRDSLPRRLAALAADLEEIQRTYQPALFVCEQLYAHYKHPRTAILMGHARGVILAVAGRSHTPVVHVSATHVKKAFTGNGRAGKQQMQRAVAALLRLPRLPEPHDVADAIAIAACVTLSGASDPLAPHAHANGSPRSRQAPGGRPRS
jgi:crossover junction endodeoxyribonuclease RuvC